MTIEFRECQQRVEIPEYLLRACYNEIEEKAKKAACIQHNFALEKLWSFPWKLSAEDREQQKVVTEEFQRTILAKNRVFHNDIESLVYRAVGLSGSGLRSFTPLMEYLERKMQNLLPPFHPEMG